jgi:hypothetical protein
MARLENPHRVKNDLVEPSLEVHPTEGLYVVRTDAQDRQEICVKVLNATHSDQKLTKGFPWHTVNQLCW